MTPSWDDVNARARGLETHLLGRGRLEALAREPDLPALVAALRRDGVVTGEDAGPTPPADLELAIRRWAAALLRTLERWAGERSLALPFVFDDEDRRSIRAMLRGAAQHAPPGARIEGLIPTPALPERALEELARATTVASVVSLLSAWHHPFAPSLAPVVGVADPDLFALESMLARAAAARAGAAARAAGDPALSRFVAEAIDLENATTAIVLSMEGRDVRPKDLFVPGGPRLSIGGFEEAIATHEPGAAGARVARALSGTPYADVLLRAGRAPGAVEDEMLHCRLRATAHEVRLAPLGPIAVMRFALRLRAQVIDLRRIVWTVALDAPRGQAGDALATVAR